MTNTVKTGIVGNRLRGEAAIHAHKVHGAPLYALNRDAKWELATGDVPARNVSVKVEDVTNVGGCKACWAVVLGAAR